MPVAVVGVLLAGVLAFVVTRALTADRDGGPVKLVAADETGEHPFTVSVNTVSLDDVALVTSGQARLESVGDDGPVAEEPSAPTPAPDAARSDSVVSVRRAAADGEVLYATTQRNVCDTAALAEALAGDDAVRATWLELMGIEERELEATIGALTPLVLARDTAVTNSLYRDGEAEQFQAILQAGTSVLVDGTGMPRVQCSCGNPLAPPEDQVGREVEGPRWDRFDPAEVVAIDAADLDTDAVLQTVDLETNTPRSVHLGGVVELGGFLVDDESGVHVVDEDGTRVTVIPEPVAVVADDGAGGLLFQYRRGQRDESQRATTEVTLTPPVDEREAAIWHLSAGAGVAEPFLSSDAPATRWFSLQTAGLLNGRPAVVYATVQFDPGAVDENQYRGAMTVRYLDTGEEHRLGGETWIYEGSFGPVTMAGDRISVDVGYDHPAYDLYDATGAAVPSGCAYPLDGETECEYLSVLATPSEFVGLHIDEARFYFSVVTVSADSGQFLGVSNGTGVVGDDATDNPPSVIDAHGGHAVISWAVDAGWGQPLPTLLIDLATGEGRLLDMTGRTRILRAPILRPREPVVDPTVSATTELASTTTAAAASGPTWDQIKGATIPSLCEQPPTTLENGVHTAIPEGMGKFELLERLEDGSPGIVTGLPSPDAGPLTAVVASCNLGGVGWPNPIVLFSGDGEFYAITMLSETDAEYALWEAQGFSHPAREQLIGIEVRGGSLVIDLYALLLGECEACETGAATVYAHAENRSLVIDRIEPG